MHRLHRLPLTVIEQAVEILTGRVALRLSTEARAEAIEKLAQSAQQRPRGARRHLCSVQDPPNQYKRYTAMAPAPTRSI